MTFDVDNEHPSFVIERHGRWHSERTVFTPARQIVAVIVPGLDAVVSAIGHPDIPLRVDIQAALTLELARTRPEAAELRTKLPSASNGFWGHRGDGHRQ